MTDRLTDIEILLEHPWIEGQYQRPSKADVQWLCSEVRRLNTEVGQPKEPSDRIIEIVDNARSNGVKYNDLVELASIAMRLTKTSQPNVIAQ